jgi:hypothetical protein
MDAVRRSRSEDRGQKNADQKKLKMPAFTVIVVPFGSGLVGE